MFQPIQAYAVAVFCCLDSSRWMHGRTEQRESQLATDIGPGVVVDQVVRCGKPVIRGIRVPVDLVIAKLPGGMAPKDVAEEYGITLEDIQAVLRYAANN